MILMDEVDRAGDASVASTNLEPTAPPPSPPVLLAPTQPASAAFMRATIQEINRADGVQPHEQRPLRALCRPEKVIVLGEDGRVVAQQLPQEETVADEASPLDPALMGSDPMIQSGREDACRDPIRRPNRSPRANSRRSPKVKPALSQEKLTDLYSKACGVAKDFLTRSYTHKDYATAPPILDTQLKLQETGELILRCCDAMLCAVAAPPPRRAAPTTQPPLQRSFGQVLRRQGLAVLEARGTLGIFLQPVRACPPRLPLQHRADPAPLHRAHCRYATARVSGAVDVLTSTYGAEALCFASFKHRVFPCIKGQDYDRVVKYTQEELEVLTEGQRSYTRTDRITMALPDNATCRATVAELNRMLQVASSDGVFQGTKYEFPPWVLLLTKPTVVQYRN